MTARLASALVLAAPLVAALPSALHAAGAAPGSCPIPWELELGPRGSATLGRGAPVARLARSYAEHEIAVVGAIRMEVPGAFLRARLRRIEEFRRGKHVRGIGTFSDPASPGDLDRLILDPDDLRDLARCEVGDCNVKLPAPVIESIRVASASDRLRPAAAVESLWREHLVALARPPLCPAPEPRAAYADRRWRVSAPAEFAALLDESWGFLAAIPDLEAQVRGLGPHPDAEEIVYWSHDDFGLKPVVVVSSMTMLARERPGCAVTGAVFRQIYASHYFEGALAVALFLEAPDPTREPGLFLYLNRVRVDGFRGALGGFRKAIAGRRARGEVERLMLELKRRLEGDWYEESLRPAATPRPPSYGRSPTP